jgi:hypothetical protein
MPSHDFSWIGRRINRLFRSDSACIFPTTLSPGLAPVIMKDIGARANGWAAIAHIAVTGGHTVNPIGRKEVASQYPVNPNGFTPRMVRTANFQDVLLILLVMSILSRDPNSRPRPRPLLHRAQRPPQLPHRLRQLSVLLQALVRVII